MSIAIAIEIGSPKSTLNLVRTTISSIMRNIGTRDYKLIIAMAPYIHNEIKDYVHSIKRDNSENIDLMQEEDYHWADFINIAIDRAQDYKYFIKSHDDIELLTPEFLLRVEDTLSGLKEPAGWVSFTDKDYLNGHWAPSTRCGFHTDYLYENAWSRQKLFQYHSLPENWWKSPFPIYTAYLIENIARSKLRLKLSLRPKKHFASLPYDFPSAPVKYHAPFNHFVLIEMDKLKKVGKCENWQTILSLAVDEDWGLRALQMGLNNVWIPDIEYVHQRPASGGDRAWVQIVKEMDRIHRLFYEKWGFNSDAKIEEIDFIRKKYKNTNILWSIDKKSYEWDYIK